MSWERQVCIKSAEEIKVMREAGIINAEALKAAAEACVPGNSTWDVNAAADAVLKKYHVVSAFKGVPGPIPYPASTCVSVNNILVHGIPSKNIVLKEGDIVSIDCTFNARGDGLTPGEFLKQVRAKYPNIIIMADCATLEEGVAAFEAGADLVGSTMNGYTPQTQDCKGEPNYELVRQLAKALPCPVIAEGRVHTPEQARRMLEIGAWAVVVGGAITRPLEIAQRYFRAIEGLTT